MGKRGRVGVWSRPIPPEQATLKHESNYSCRGCPQGARARRPTSGSPAIGKMSPPERLGRLAGLTLGRARGLWKRETPLLRDTPKIHTLRDSGQKQ